MEPYRLDVKGKINYYILPPEMNFLAQVPEDKDEHGNPVVFPKEFTILAAFDEKGLAGRTMIVPLPHIEGTWVREDLRKGRVGYVLIKELEKSILAADRTFAWAFADTEEREDYLTRLGYQRQQVSVWYKKLEEK